MIRINQQIPDMAVTAYQDGDIKRVTLHSFKGKWLLLIFYPGDFTFVCPTELSETADHYEEIKAMGVEVASVSCDSAHTHKAWQDTSPSIKKVKFPMLADMTGQMSKEFGVYLEEEGQPLRGTFIIDPYGTLKCIEINENSIGRNIKESIRKIKAAQFVSTHDGMVCPASWDEGKEAMTKDLSQVGKI